jgi:hypothetical protein
MEGVLVVMQRFGVSLRKICKERKMGRKRGVIYEWEVNIKGL